MKNKLIDLNNHLFEQLERLNDDDLQGDDLAQEIKRSQAMSNCAAQIVNNAHLALKAHQAINDGLIEDALKEMDDEGADGFDYKIGEIRGMNLRIVAEPEKGAVEIVILAGPLTYTAVVDG